jgi:catecholate siderophore receptor
MNGHLDLDDAIHPLSRGIVAALGVPVATIGLLGAVPTARAQPEAMEEVVVTDSLRTRYLIDQSTLGSKFTESLRDTPQSVTLLSQAMLEDRNVMTLDDALRNVPGITLSAGEFKWMGNGPTIRGFPARNDMYIDGIRDLGFYNRDPFNLEAVEVLQGPSSIAFGRGSTGGVINQSSKKPLGEAMRSVHVNVGSANTMRATADLNQPLSDDAALRVNLLAHQSDVPGRNVVETSRYGIAPSLALELGDATKLTLNYLYQDSDSIPDYGLPWVGNRPANVDRANYYGFEDDWLDNTTGIFSAILDHRLNDALALNAHVRYADYERSSRLTEPQVDPSVDPSTPPELVTVQRLVYGSEGNENVLQGQLNVRADFATGNVSHTVVTGLELSKESTDTYFAFAGVPRSFPITAPVPDTNLATPGGVFTGIVPKRLSADTTSDTVAVFALDTIKLGEQWQLLVGLRWDRFETDYTELRFEEDGTQSGSDRFITEDSEPSYRTALVYKPVPHGTIYLGWGTSFNPATESVTQIDSGRGLSVPNVNLEPQKNESLELGLKWDLLGRGLLLDASVFQIAKTHAYVPDPLNPGRNIDAGNEKVNGLAVSLNGSIGDIMQMMIGYTYLDDERKNTLTGAKSHMDNVPQNNFSFWLNWAASSKLGLGAGARYVDERFWGNKSVPDYWTFDAMARYRWSDTISFKLNLTNITDEYYFDQLHPWHVFPGHGRAAVLAVNFDY